ncbi:hypothetical protein SAMN05421831_10429 [Allopseudospirillum japonicum]|uniref:DUF1315 family protein n=1 Tax=Allopseudospirillum japonicum TaxID=64971 RepID=A0A1H6RJF6_9GAMM|nr:DUF1315 family protein [Allopseudospirillum japonicum]SEI54616.1 hypothetical protein SAMN05421831_10429 [Allopseudospirillum japonicum]
MTFDQMINHMTADIYHNLKRAVELRKWPDGRRLTEQQVELCMEAVLKYEISHQIPEQERVGFLDRRSCKTNEQADTIRWAN